MFLTLCQVRDNALEIPPTKLEQHPAQLLAEKDLGVSVVELQPLQIGRRYLRHSANIASPTPVPSGNPSLEIHRIRWPVLAMGHWKKPQIFWPGAGFAFPFACSNLVDILHERHYDILIAEDVPFSGYVAWRLREITGIPYVIICGHNELLTLQSPGLGPKALYAAIGRDAEMVVGCGTGKPSIEAGVAGIRFRFMENQSLSREQLKDLLEQAVRQSADSFDW